MIISKFKDYYDYLGQIYGIDQSFAYNRELYDRNYSKYYSISRKKTNIPQYIWHHSKNTIKTCHLLIVGRLFLLYDIVPKENTHIYKFNDLNYKLYAGEPEISKELGIKTKHLIEKEHKYYFKYREPIYQEDIDGSKVNSLILQINILYKSPIIVAYPIGYPDNSCIYALASPILGDIPKFASVYPAERIYTDIEYFFLNQINGSPDADPPVQVSEENKIISKGFDIKRSFRPKMK